MTLWEFFWLYVQTKLILIAFGIPLFLLCFILWYKLVFKKQEQIGNKNNL